LLKHTKKKSISGGGGGGGGGFGDSLSGCGWIGGVIVVVWAQDLGRSCSAVAYIVCANVDESPSFWFVWNIAFDLALMLCLCAFATVDVD
jgi:hypothetical protein